MVEKKVKEFDPLTVCGPDQYYVYRDHKGGDVITTSLDTVARLVFRGVTVCFVDNTGIRKI